MLSIIHKIAKSKSYKLAAKVTAKELVVFIVCRASYKQFQAKESHFSTF